MSIDTIRDKLAKAVAERQGLAKAPAPITFAEVTNGDPITRTQTRGRPRKRYRASDVSLDASKTIRLWASERITASPGNVALVGSGHDRSRKVQGAGVVHYRPLYERRTLIEDFTQWSLGKGWPRPTISTSFGALVVLAAAEMSIPAKPIRTAWRRRAAIAGVQLAGEQYWDGHETVPWRKSPTNRGNENE